MALVAMAVSAIAQCSETSLDLRGEWGQGRFTVEVADDAGERSQGLMFREHMPASAGMLFIYPTAQSVGFWMKNTLIPLDMLFIDAQGTVIRIHEMAIPHDTTVIDGGDGVLEVLEINGGMVETLGITVGTQVRHPSFEQKFAVWPCEGS